MSLSLIAVLVVFPALMIYAAASDIVSMTISNRLCLLLVLAFAVCAALLGLSWTEIGLHVAAGFLVLMLCFGLFAAGLIGGGDAKLAAATALWFGFGPLLPYLVVTAIAGGAVAVVMFALRSAPVPDVMKNWIVVQRLHSAEKCVPYGVALAIGALVVLPQTAIFRAAIGV